MPIMVTRNRGRRAINEINMVPFIDVMLVLLIIFMVTAPLIAPSVIDLPRVGKATVPPATVIQISIDKSETIKLKLEGQEERVLPLNQLAAAVKTAQRSASSPAPVVIAADKAIRYETVVKTMDTLQRAGVQRVGLSVQSGAQ